jgi:hypothetical protein
MQLGAREVRLCRAGLEEAEPGGGLPVGPAPMLGPDSDSMGVTNDSASARSRESS